MAVHAAPEPITSEPLILGSSQAPANLYLTPSVEYPTINSQANTDPVYSSSKEFVGYFNSDACYDYVYDATADQRRFEPRDATSDRRCDATDGDWSGNFLNWAATQTIDPFRKALTGGLRVKDTTETTWLEKARYDNSGGSGIFPNRSITDANELAGATPFGAYSELHTRVYHLGTEMRFRVDNTLGGQSSNIDYDPAQDYNGSATGTLDPGEAYEVEIRVEVCDEDSAAGVEDNCVAYGDNYKPEGLIQANDENLRYSVFGYLNDDDVLRDGGVLRAKKKYVGPEKIDPATGEKVSNPNAEWDSEGRLIQNPNPNEATNTENYYGVTGLTIENSGVINYINKFGQLTNNSHKEYDPVSELFYAMTRYLRNEGPVESYHARRQGEGASEVQKWTDDFPVVTQWDDPVAGFECSPNVALGIGDVFTHRDKNLPGSPYSTDEPATPSEVSNDSEVDVVDLTNKIGALEGLGDIGATNSWSGRYNSAYIAGLAYDAHTRDQRPNVDGEQRLSTYWVDVVENQDLKDFSENPYALAAKYGGFAVPSDFDPDTRTDPLPDDWWWSGENASIPNDTTSFKRPENYFLANNAKAMTEGLAKAFNRINTEAQGSSAAVATNTTRLTTSTLIYQGRFNSVDWSGDVLALDVDDTDGTVDTTTPVWQASENVPAPGNRNLFTVENAAGGVHQSGTKFQWTGTDTITAAQQDQLNDNPETEAFDDDGKGEQRLEYIRGDATNEQRNGGGFRNRLNTVLGDIVNSNPYVARGQNFGYGSVPGDAGVTYRNYVEAKQPRRDILYVGANDGMLHAIDATDTGGDELFAYIPNAAFDGLNRLSSTAYTHRFFVDGSPSVADVYADLDSDGGDRDGNGSNADWHSLLAGSMGAGGKAVFVLDVTNPLGTTFSGSAFGMDDVLFEFTDPELGHTFGQPRLVPINDGAGGADWVLLVGDGYDDTTDDGSGNTIVEGDGSETAGLHVIPLENPGNAVFIDTADYYTDHVGTSDDPNGISEVTPVDIDGDRVTDFVYAGDLEGNMWKFDPTTGSETVQRLFRAVDSANGNPQPITTPPAVGPNDDPDVLLNVYFGTGQFFREGDGAVGTDPQVQTFYAVADRNDGSEVNDNGLVEQSIVYQDSDFRITSNNDVDYGSNKDGWFIDLIPPSLTAGTGERVINPPVLRDDRIIFQTNIPEPGICKVGGRSWLMEMDAQDGIRLENGVFDTDGDGDVDADDKIDDGSGDLKHAGGQAIDGLSAGLAILDTDREIEFKQISKSSGEVETVTESQSQANTGRKSWEQLR